MVATQDNRLCDVNYILDNRSQQLVLEAWGRLEACGEPQVAHSELPLADSEKPHHLQFPSRRRPPNPTPHSPPVGPGLLPLKDFGLYKCEVCSKMVMRRPIKSKRS